MYLQYQLLMQSDQGLPGIVAETGMYLSRLYDCTPGSSQPTEPGGKIELAYGPCLFTSFRDTVKGIQVCLYFTDIYFRGESTQAVFIQRNHRL
jgi:hypothetical protein